MRKQMIEDAAFEVATQVRAVEDSIDAMLAELAELQTRMMHVNTVARVGPAPIHAALTAGFRCTRQPDFRARRDCRLPWRAGYGEGQSPGPADRRLRR